MKQSYRILSVLISIGFVFAAVSPGLGQYQITLAQYPALGTSSTFQVDTTGHITVDLGSGGQGQTWDFTQDLTGLEYTAEFVDINATAYKDTFPTAEWAYETYQFISMDASIITGNVPIKDLFTLSIMERVEGNNIHGVGVRAITPFYAGNFVYQDETVNYSMPLELGKSWERNAVYTSDSVGVEFAGSTIYVDVEIGDTAQIEVDATGDLTIPLGTFPCLRQKIQRRLVINVYFTGTTTRVYQSIDDVIQYEWHTQDGGMLLQVSSHGDETDPDFTDAGLVVRLTESNVLTGIGCDPDCNTTNPVVNNFALEHNYPNPFNPSTVIPYAIAEPSQVRLSVLNLLGQEVAVIASGIREKGSFTAVWTGRDTAGRVLPAGVYFYRLKALPLRGGEAFLQTRKMVLTQ
jgi:hypothetical protein